MRRAAEMYHVPKSTLQDRVSEPIPFGSKSGPPPYLTVDEEMELVTFIERCSVIGYSRSKQQILQLVQQVTDKKGLKVTVSDGWWHWWASFN